MKTNNHSKRYSISKYDFFEDTIVLCIDDFLKERGIYPNYLFANTITFRRISEAMPEMTDIVDGDDDSSDENWESSLGESPKYRDTEYLLSGYISDQWAIEYLLNQAISDDEIELKYIED